MKKIGDKATERLDAIGKTLTGTVVYIHPKGRFYTVKFVFPLGSFRESFTEIKYDWHSGGTK